jgi:hypothetical protein
MRILTSRDRSALRKPTITVKQLTFPRDFPIRSSQRLFGSSIRKPRDQYLDYRPVMTGAMRYGGQEGAFDIRELGFGGPPRVTTLPKPIRVRRNPRFAVPESGSCDDRAPCGMCGRFFARDRLPKHESVCIGHLKRPVFDSREQRMAGTEAARFFRGYSRPIPKDRARFKDERRAPVGARRGTAAGNRQGMARTLGRSKAKGPPLRGRTGRR